MNDYYGKTILRVVGQVPYEVELTPVEPTLEDAYLLLMRRASYQADCSNEANTNKPLRQSSRKDCLMKT